MKVPYGKSQYGAYYTSTISRRQGRSRKRVKELLKLGRSKRQAIFTAVSRKSYWHLSKTLATRVGMTNQWLKKQWLISIRELWISVHYPNNTR